MTIEGEAAGDVLTGAIVATAIDGKQGATTAPGAGHGACRNCGATLTGNYCASCGQAAHIHRSLVSLGHDILHSVFHFEGRIWRTIPELFLRPGHLTRRYIDGERVKFVSPMALFLFTVFLMFAVFAFTSGSLLSDTTKGTEVVTSNWQAGNQSAIDASRQKIAALQQELQTPELTPDRRVAIEKDIAGLESSITVMEALAKGEWQRLADLEKQQAAKTEDNDNDLQVDLGSPTLNSRLKEGLRHINDNPQLLLYKLKINGYKFSWALIPLSIPFLWMLFFWRRDIHLYDHAIFATYSISFMMLLMMLVSIAAALGAGPGIWVTALLTIPPYHMYKQLRGAYGLSRFGAFVRLIFLLISATIVLTLFTVLLGLLGLIA